MFATAYEDYYRKASLRSLSSMQMIPEGVFCRRLREFEAYCRARVQKGPLLELGDLFLLQRKTEEEAL